MCIRPNGKKYVFSVPRGQGKKGSDQLWAYSANLKYKSKSGQIFNMNR